MELEFLKKVNKNKKKRYKNKMSKEIIKLKVNKIWNNKKDKLSKIS